MKAIVSKEVKESSRRRSVMSAGWLADESASSRSNKSLLISAKDNKESQSQKDDEKDADVQEDIKLDALDVVAKEMDKIKAISQLEQIKISTEMALGVLS